MNRLVRQAAILALAAFPAIAQIDTSVIDRYREALQRQASSPETKREGGTQTADWVYALPEGVTTRQVTFYSDGAACYGKVFFPKGFSATGQWPAVVLGHGFNALAIALEKYAARFAERGLVAMAIDYRTYGFSASQVSLLEPDASTDAQRVGVRDARVRLKRTRLNAFRQAEDYRAAISYIQGEPGVDPRRIGVWGSSHAGGVVVSVAGLDARVKAVVAQVIGVGGRNQSGPPQLPANLQQDAILRARSGQGAEIDGGFSFRTKIDLETSQTGREHRPWSMLARIPESTAILWIPAEKDELANPRSPSGPSEAAKVFKGVSQVAEVPSITHFQVYSGAAFEVSSTLAADWFLKYLDVGRVPAGAPALAKARIPPPVPQSAPAKPESVPAGITTRDIHFFSEGVRCYGRLFLPAGFSAEGKVPGVLLAPGWGRTHGSLTADAAALAAAGIAALAIDYRGWGKSGGYLYTEPVHTDDRYRFMQMTARVFTVRKRLLPAHQIDDIRNALSFLVGEPGIDPARVGLWGEGVAGGHVLSVAARDTRVKAAAVSSPLLAGLDIPAGAYQPPHSLLADAIGLARGVPGQATAAAGAAAETRLAFDEYRPFHLLDQIPASTAVLFVVDGQAAEQAAAAAKKLLKGAIAVESGADRAKGRTVVAAWFERSL